MRANLTGYADFPIGAFYFGAIMSLLLAIQERSPTWLRIAGIFGAGVAWTKQEGLILWATFAIAAAVAITVGKFLQRQYKALLWALMPGVAVLSCWHLFLTWSNAGKSDAYLPVTLSVFVKNLDRVPEIGMAFLREFSSWEKWSLLWPACALALVGLIYARQVSKAFILTASVLVPLFAYFFAYVFSSWDPYMDHLLTSFHRILLQHSLLAILTITLIVPSVRRGATRR